MQTTGSNRLVVRPVQPDDLPQLLGFLNKNYPASPHKADPERFQHRFAGHPWGSALGRYMVALAGDQIVGQLAALPDRIHCRGTWLDAWWLVDLMVAPEHRGGLAALRLFQSQMSGDSLLLATGAGPHLVSLYEALGWRRCPIAQTCYLPIRPGRLLNMATSMGRVPRRPLLRPAQWTADKLLPWAQRLRSLAGREARSVSIEPLREFGVEIEQLTEKLLPTLGNTCWRSAETLVWKMNRGSRSPLMGFTARGREDGALCGYLVAKRLRREGTATWVEVVDYLAAPSDCGAFDALASAVVRQALSEPIDFVRWRLSCAPHLARLRFPWWLRRTEPVADEVFIHCRDPNLLSALAKDSWHLTSLASDRADGGTEVMRTS